MPAGTFSSPPRVSDPDMYHGTCVTHVPWCMPGSLTNGFPWSRWREKRSRHPRRMRNPQFCVSVKRPMACRLFWVYAITGTNVGLVSIALYGNKLQWRLILNTKLFIWENFLAQSWRINTINTSEYIWDIINMCKFYQTFYSSNEKAKSLCPV